MSVWSWWLDDPTLTSAVMTLGSFEKMRMGKGENAISKQLRVDWTLYNIELKKRHISRQELLFSSQEPLGGAATGTRSNLVVEFLFSFKKLQTFRNCLAYDNITENLRIFSTLFGNKYNASLSLLLALSSLMILSFSFHKWVYSVLVLPLQQQEIKCKWATQCCHLNYYDV